jgi:thiol:disulfide interchange protein DsbC
VSLTKLIDPQENNLGIRINYFVAVLCVAVLVCSAFYIKHLSATQVGEVEAGKVEVADKESVTEKLRLARPDLVFTVMGPAPIADFYEVQVKNGPLFFVHRNGDYFFQGGLYQVQSGRIVDILENRLIEKRRALFATRSTEDMIVFKPEGETKAIMNIFTDVDCGYCRKLHREVPELNAVGIEVRYLAYPRAGIPSGSYSKIATAWCAEDQQDILTKVKSGQNVPHAVCDNNPVADHYALGDSLGVTGTPAIVLMDGTLIPGYQPAANFAEYFGLTPNEG